MKISQNILKQADIVPKLKLAVKTDKGVQGTGPHRIKVIVDKEAKGTDPITGKERDELAYLVEESGIKKSWRVPKFNKSGEIHYLVQRLAEIEEGEEVVVEYKRKGIKGYIDVIRVKHNTDEVEDDFTDDIPIIGLEDENIKEDNNPLL